MLISQKKHNVQAIGGAAAARQLHRLFDGALDLSEPFGMLRLVILDD